MIWGGFTFFSYLFIFVEVSLFNSPLSTGNVGLHYSKHSTVDATLL